MEAGSVEYLPLIVIVGPTASGKTAIAVELAKKFGGEIICADSRTIYKGMDIGTAKPTQEERSTVPHWGLDLIEPGQRFTAADFKKYAMTKIGEIRSRGHIPFLVGGSGLYVDAVIFDFQFAPSSPVRREKFEKMTVHELQEYCLENNIILPENRHNKRYLVRAIERDGTALQRRATPINTSIIVGISTDREVLRVRIHQRAEQIFDDNVVKEATVLGKKYGWDSEAMTGNIYPIIRKWLKGELSQDEMIERFEVADWRLAKRQLTWLKRNPHINWLSASDAMKYIEDQLAKGSKT